MLLLYLCNWLYIESSSLLTLLDCLNHMQDYLFIEVYLVCEYYNIKSEPQNHFAYLFV